MTAPVLVLNSGSSSLKIAIVDPVTGARVADGVVERVGSDDALWTLDDAAPAPVDAPDHVAAVAHALPRLLERTADGTAASISAVGHRVVHGGEHFAHPVEIDDEVLSQIEELASLAPLHNPANAAGIRAAQAALPDLPHIAVFDTAFHATLPRRAREYALDYETRSELGIRRYGFHGPSHHYVATRAAEYLGADVRDLRLITCHLGNGCSMAAIEYGRSIETSMGMTPLEGLVMGTRSGDVDPGVLIHMLRAGEMSVDELDAELNKRAGPAGVSRVGNDMRDIEDRAGRGDEDCQLAIHLFAHRIRKYIGAYAAVMGGADAVVFTAGIGENSALIRHRVAQRLDFFGARLDEEANRSARVTQERPVAEISMRHSRTRLLVVRTDEAHAIAEETARLVASKQPSQSLPPIPVAISARHVHLRPETIEKLFGAGHELTVRNPLSQPGQFASEETVTLVGPKRKLEGVRILGPARPYDQVEISRTDEFHLGVDAPVRASGDLDGTPGIKVVGPNGSVELEEGVICAWRHIHMTPEDAARYGVSDRDVVDVAIESDGRSLVFGDVLIRVKPTYALEMHIDTDEGNAADLGRHATGALVTTPSSARVTRRKTEFDAVDE